MATELQELMAVYKNKFEHVSKLLKQRYNKHAKQKQYILNKTV